MAWRGAVVTAVWVCAVVTASGLGAWTLAHGDTGGRDARALPLDEAGVRERLAALRSGKDTERDGERPPATGPAAVPPPRRTAAPERDTGGGTVRLTGGSVTARCRTGGQVYLTAWSPGPGYHVDDEVRRGPAATAAIEFEVLDDDAGEDRSYEIRCAGSRPAARAAADDDED